MNAKQHVSVAYQDFLSGLEKELKYLKDGGTSYRIKTAELSLMVAKTVKDVSLFLDREVALKTVTKLLPSADFNRLKDVAKMLNVVLGCLNLDTTLSDEVKEKFFERKSKRRALKLVPVA